MNPLKSLFHTMLHQRGKRLYVASPNAEPQGQAALKARLAPPPSFPEGKDEAAMRAFFRRIHPEALKPGELEHYAEESALRFLHTYDLMRDITSGRCLELGANPYFFTVLLKELTSLQLTCNSWFKPDLPPELDDTVYWNDLRTGEPRELPVRYQHFNVETEPFPYADAGFEVVVFAEVLEHVLEDPFGILAEIHRVLVPGGTLILSTPNAARLENIMELVYGKNVFGPYSGYGPYGRHNREYTRAETVALCEAAGFAVDSSRTLDTYPANPCFQNEELLKRLMDAMHGMLDDEQGRLDDLGQTILLRAHKAGAPCERPDWLYKSL